jgi:hypothetical protein
MQIERNDQKRKNQEIKNKTIHEMSVEDRKDLTIDNPDRRKA